MPKSKNQKLKLLYLKDYLLKYTDDNHHVYTKDIIEHLALYDIDVERKTVYTDLDDLRQYGLDVNKDGWGYYIGERDFNLSEIKLLIDAVYSSKFITEKKSKSLIKKLENLTNVYDGKSLDRQIIVQNRVKNENESVFYNIDNISSAITDNKKIKFKYFKHKPDKSKEYRHDGKFYKISPFALIWDNLNYYMIGYDEEVGMLKNYRVDRMTNISAINEKRVGTDAFKKVNKKTYRTAMFGMFAGQEEVVKIKFDNSLVDAVIDKFGKDVIIIDKFDGTFEINVNVQISPNFYAWIFAFYDKCEIIEPQNIRDDFQNKLKNVIQKY